MAKESKIQHVEKYRHFGSILTTDGKSEIKVMTKTAKAKQSLRRNPVLQYHGSGGEKYIGEGLCEESYVLYRCEHKFLERETAVESTLLRYG